MLYTVFSECVNEAPESLFQNAVYIKQHVFPSEVLAWASALSAVFSFLVNLLILVVFDVLILGVPGYAALYMPLMIVPVLLWTLGVVWIVSSIGVYLRDLGQVIPPLTTALLFLSPIFYPASRVPESFRWIYEFNPFVFILETARGALFYNRPPDWLGLGLCVLVAWLVAWCGYNCFVATKKGFADVL